MQVKQISWFSEHYYRIDLDNEGQVYLPSVTTKLSAVGAPFLAKWRGDIGNELADKRLKESQQKGSSIHKAFETYVKGGEVFVNLNGEYDNEPEVIDAHPRYFIEDQDEALAFWRLVQFVKAVKPTILESERMVYSLKFREAGTTDGVISIKSGTYEVNGSKPLSLPEGLYVVDIKSGKSVSDTAFLQMSAYAKMLEEMGLYKDLAGALVLHTGSQNRKGIEGFATHYISRGEIDDFYKVYRHASAIWEWQNKYGLNFKPRVFNLPTRYMFK